jgi:DNA-binding response OmpR family regulator
VKILIYSDNKWVIESIEKYIDFEYKLMENIDIEDLNDRVDFIFVDMQVKNNGGPSIIRELKRQKITTNIPIALIADREADEFQANRVGADFFAVKPLSKTKLNNFFNKE